MATTYSTNADLILDNGTSVDEFLLQTLTDQEKIDRKDAARLRGYNLINDIYLRGKTAIPADHIDELLQVEIDFVVADILSGAYTGQTSNVSEWAAQYRERAEDNMKKLRYDASVEDASAEAENVGDGTVALTPNDSYCLTEKWILRCGSNGKFLAHGSLHGYLPNDVTVGTRYPEKEFTSQLGDYGRLRPRLRYEEFPISFLITAGSAAFVQDDKFTFMSYAASYYRGITGDIMRG